ncbi:MAG: anti-sigma factor [bacterium]|nr:anti-sigma factor [bacterium]
MYAKKIIILPLFFLLLIGASCYGPEVQVTEDTSVNMVNAIGFTEDLVAAENDRVAEVEDELDVIEPDLMFYEDSTTEYQYKAELEDITRGDSSGVVQARLEDGVYQLYATFEDLPVPADGFFYEGWIVRNNPLDVISTGGLLDDAGVEENVFQLEQDLTDHDFYILTIESDDGDPAPADHVLEGTMLAL